MSISVEELELAGGSKRVGGIFNSVTSRHCQGHEETKAASSRGSRLAAWEFGTGTKALDLFWETTLQCSLSMDLDVY